MALKRRHEEHENHERWLVSYADFITLLFAFFTVLYAISSADLKKQEEFEESIKKSFAGFIGMGSGGSDFTEVNDSRNTSAIPPIMPLFPPRGSGNAEIEGYVEKQLEKEMGKDDKAENVKSVYHDSVGVRIQMAANKLFAVGSAELRDDSATALDKLGKLLKDSNRRLIIEGHTDDQPIKTEKFPSNWELSAARATKIVRYLVAKHRIPASHLTAVAYADQKPVAPNDSEEHRARNRRIEIMIVTAKQDGL